MGNNPFGKYTFFYGGNRGRGQVYPEGNNSNNNQFSANATGTVTAIDGLKVSIKKADGSSSVVECGAGADVVVEVGEVVKNGEPITTNPNVGGLPGGKGISVAGHESSVRLLCHRH